jgi:hypothetical protein
VIVPTDVLWGFEFFPDSTATVGLKNIGTGPALGIVAFLELLTADGLPAGHGGEPVSEGEVAIGAGAADEVSVATAHWAKGACFAITLEYRDVAEKRWVTKGSYLVDATDPADAGRWENVRLPGSDRPPKRPTIRLQPRLIASMREMERRLPK